MRRIGTELRWLGLGFGIPFLGIIVFDVFTVPSPFSWWQKLLKWEDICGYGSCLIFPLFVYGAVSVGRMGYAMIREFKRWRGPTSGKTRPEKFPASILLPDPPQYVTPNSARGKHSSLIHSIPFPML